jgi:hypothetical protein
MNFLIQAIKKYPKTYAALAIVFIAAVLLFTQRYRIYKSIYQRRVTACTTALPQCDRIEVYSLDPDGKRVDAHSENSFPIKPYGGACKILHHATLSAQDTDAFTQIWRLHEFGSEWSGMCHYPGYGLRFYSGSTLQFETSLCFLCTNFYVTYMGESHWCGFNGRAETIELLRILQKAIPESIPSEEKLQKLPRFFREASLRKQSDH